MSRIAANVCEWVDDAADEDDGWARRRHIQNLQRICADVRWKTIRSSVCCITCLIGTPQHPVSCGHAICDDCVSAFGRPLSQEYSYSLTSCPLCDTAIVEQQVILKPPTAGVRILTVDGGGSRGVVPLELMKTLQSELGPGQTIQDYFDIAFGVSAGTGDSPFPPRPQLLTGQQGASSPSRCLRCTGTFPNASSASVVPSPRR